jgi:hypothetical protein
VADPTITVEHASPAPNASRVRLAARFVKLGRQCQRVPRTHTVRPVSRGRGLDWADRTTCSYLRNIVLQNGTPTLFDGVEFNDEIACVDVLYDLAFLLMDLWRRQLSAHANAVWNRYLAETEDLSGIGLMPFFLSCRAAIRATTNATALAVQTDSARGRELQISAREYLAMAEGLLHPPPACLVAIGGLSGSGKTTIAAALAPLVGAVPGAIVLRSDEIRKQICGVPSLTRLSPEAYTNEITNRVYETLTERMHLNIADSEIMQRVRCCLDQTPERLSLSIRLMPCAPVIMHG